MTPEMTRKKIAKTSQKIYNKWARRIDLITEMCDLLGLKYTGDYVANGEAAIIPNTYLIQILDTRRDDCYKATERMTKVEAI